MYILLNMIRIALNEVVLEVVTTVMVRRVVRVVLSTYVTILDYAQTEKI